MAGGPRLRLLRTYESCRDYSAEGACSNQARVMYRTILSSFFRGAFQIKRAHNHISLAPKPSTDSVADGPRLRMLSGLDQKYFSRVIFSCRRHSIIITTK